MFIWSFAGFTELKVQVFKKFRKVVKAVSPILAVLLMIAIAVIAAIVAYFWLMGYIRFQTSKTGKAIQIQSVAHTGTYLLVYTQNVGQGTVRFVPSECLYLDGILQSGAGIDLDTLKEGETATVDAEFPITLGQRIKIKVVTEEGVFAEGTFTIAVFSGGYTLTVTTIGGGSVDLDPYETGYLGGTVVKLTATADIGWFFSEWSGDLTGSDNPVNITMNGDKAVTATFTQIDYTLIIDVSPLGSGSVSRNPDQLTYHYGDSVQLQATAATGWTFSGWSGDLTGSINPDYVTIDLDPAVTATFTQNDYVLTVNIVGSGSVFRNPDQLTYHYGDIVQLLATADPGWAFTGWSGDLTGSANPDSFTIDETPFVTATFTQNQYTIAVSVVGQGSVARNASEPYVYGQAVNLTAIPQAGWSFQDWSGDLTGSANPATITLDANKSVTATFTQDSYPLTMITIGQGTVNPGNVSRLSGTVVDIEAINAPGWTFIGWSGDASGLLNTTVTMDGPRTVAAIFSQDSYTLTMYTTGEGSVNPGNQTYLSGTVVNIEAINAPGWTFTGWTGDAAGTSNATVTMNGPRTVTATFTQDEYTLTVNIVGSGSVTKNPNKPTYHYGDEVQLTAVPNLHWGFSAWSGDLVGTVSPANITITGNNIVTATFVQSQFQITVTASPAEAIGGTFKVTYVKDGETNSEVLKATEWTEWVDAGTDVTVSQPQQYIPSASGVGGVRYNFTQYAPSASVTMTEAKTITLVYKTQYYLAMSTNYGTVSPGTGWYDAGSTLSISASAPSTVDGERYVWNGWTGSGTISYSGTANPAADAVTMNSPITETAAWTHQYLLTVETDPAGLSPQPSRNPAGEANTANSWWYDASSSVDLTAQSVTGYTFDYWDADGTSQGNGVNPITVAITSPRTATAHYTTSIPGTIIFFDNFNDGIIENEPHWSLSGDYTPHCENDEPAYPGASYYAELRGSWWGDNGRITLTISTQDYSGIQLSYWRTDRPFWDDDYVRVEWRVGTSGGWTLIEDYYSNVWAQNAYSFPASADDRNPIQIRFTVMANSPYDYGYIDDVLVTGTPLPPHVTFVSAGTGSGSTNGNPTPGYPAGLQANDLILLQVTVRDPSSTPTTPTGFTLLYGPDSTGTGRQWIYYKFSTGTESGTITVTIGGSATKMARMYAFRNVALSSFTEDPDFGSGTDSSIEARSVTTTGNGRLAVSFVFVNNDNSVGSFTGESGGDWQEAVNEFTYNPSGSSNDGCIQLQTATMASAGTISGGSYDMGYYNSDPWGVRAFALKPQ